MTLESYLYFVILPILAISALLVFVRFLKGPTLSDRVITLDLLVTIGIGFICMYAVINDKPTFLDIAMILALIALLGTIAFSYYIEKKGRNNNDSN